MADPLDVLTLPEAKSAVKLLQSTQDDVKLTAKVTAVSRRLDILVGPVVRRSVVDELDADGDMAVFLSKYPITSVQSVVEYTGAGVALALTQETTSVKPEDGFRLKRYSADSTLYGSELERRTAGGAFVFPVGDVVVTYTAGRFDTTATVDEWFKEAARLMLKNLWRAEQESVGQVGEYEVPMVHFPTFSVPRAVVELFPGEIQGHHLT